MLSCFWFGVSDEMESQTDLVQLKGMTRWSANLQKDLGLNLDRITHWMWSLFPLFPSVVFPDSISVYKSPIFVTRFYVQLIYVPCLYFLLLCRVLFQFAHNFCSLSLIDYNVCSLSVSFWSSFTLTLSWSFFFIPFFRVFVSFWYVSDLASISY